MRYSRRQIIVFAFTALSLASVVYISFATVNYVRFFPAIREFQDSYQINSITFVQSATSSPSVLQLLVNVTNPSQFAGFQLHQVMLTLFFFPQGNLSNALFLPPSNEPNATQRLDTPLGPGDVDLVTIAIPLEASQTTQLVMFSQRYPNQVVGKVNLTIEIDSFLLSVTGSLSYTRLQNVLLSVAS